MVGHSLGSHESDTNGAGGSNYESEDKFDFNRFINYNDESPLDTSVSVTQG